ncbi:unnamed protein product [Rhizophagus irregularis]|nr:unnamed protein product [Rhizophagus irregularis]CAB5376406.1 unnamed protein product [Rhizophagus irregularis]
MTALLVTPSELRVHVHTDSQAAIDGINTVNNMSKRLNIEIHKVKGHSGCHWNDMADVIAKIGREMAVVNSNRLVDLQFICSYSCPLLFLPNGIGPHTGTINKSCCDNIDTNNTLINFIKSSNNLLPTVDNLRKHNDIYDDVPCPACRDHEETLNHLVICAGLEQAFLTAEKEMIDKIRKYLKHSKCKNLSRSMNSTSPYLNIETQLSLN